MKKLSNIFNSHTLNFLLILGSLINRMGSKREKYPERCPWDLGPNQHLAKEENWTLRLGCLLYTSDAADE